MESNQQETLLEQMPRHRARRRSPLRDQETLQSQSDRGGKGATPDPFSKPAEVDPEVVAAFVDGVRAVAEVADLALTAAALVLREIQAKLPPAGSKTTAAKD
jgi:hypothetical protein